jgi:hypothetical protein
MQNPSRIYGSTAGRLRPAAAPPTDSLHCASCRTSTTLTFSTTERGGAERASYLAWIGRASLPKGSCLLDLLLSLISCNFLFGSCNRQHGTVQYRRSCCKFSFCVLGLIIIWCYE